MKHSQRLEQIEAAAEQRRAEELAELDAAFDAADPEQLTEAELDHLIAEAIRLWELPEPIWRGDIDQTLADWDRAIDAGGYEYI